MPLPALLKIPNRSNIYVYIFVVKLQNTNTRKAEGKKKHNMKPITCVLTRNVQTFQGKNEFSD